MGPCTVAAVTFLRLTAVALILAWFQAVQVPDAAALGGVDLSVLIQHVSGRLEVGVQDQYTIHVFNRSVADAEGTTRVRIGPIPTDLRVSSVGTAVGEGWACTEPDFATVAQFYFCDIVGARFPAIAVKLVPTVATTTARMFDVAVDHFETAADPTPDDNYTTAIIPPVQERVDLAIAVTVDGPFTVGAPASFTVVISNRGPGPTSGSTLVTPVAEIPAALTDATASGAGWACTTGPGIQCSSTDSVAPGASFPQIVYRVTPSGASAPFVAFWLQTQPANNSDLDFSDNGVMTCAAVAPEQDPASARSDLALDVANGAGSFTVDIANLGPLPTAGTTCVHFTLPKATTFTSPASGDGWTCGASPVTGFLCTTTAVVAPGAAYRTITVPFGAPDAGVATGPFRATASNAWDTDRTNNSDTGVADPTPVSTTTTTLAIPTSPDPRGQLPPTGSTSLWPAGLGTTFLALGAASMTASRRRPRSKWMSSDRS